MQSTDLPVDARLRRLEASQRRGWAVAGALILAMLGLSAATAQGTEVVDRIVDRDLIVVDEAGTPRIRIGADDMAGRRDCAVGLVMFDATGTERGGMTTFEDGSAILPRCSCESWGSDA